jgi:hypothetical protein
VLQLIIAKEETLFHLFWDCPFEDLKLKTDILLQWRLLFWQHGAYGSLETIKFSEMSKLLSKDGELPMCQSFLNGLATK